MNHKLSNSSGSSGGVRGGGEVEQHEIFFMTYVYRAGGGMAPLTPAESATVIPHFSYYVTRIDIRTRLPLERSSHKKSYNLNSDST